MQRRNVKPDSGWAKTNPVWSIRTFHDSTANFLNPLSSDEALRRWIENACSAGVHFPDSVKKEYQHLFPISSQHVNPPHPRVIGLLVQSSQASTTMTGFVDPLIVKRSRDGWSVADSLPFRESHVQDALFRLLRQSGLQISDAVPELVGFSITDDLQESPDGASMNIAALLAVIDTFNDQSSALFQCACAVVQPNGNDLEHVGSVDEKLAGFVREYGRGSLLVRHPTCEASEKYISYFAEVWEVNSFAELAERLFSINQFTAVLQSYPLRLAHVESARSIIRRLEQEQRIDEALSFAYRLEKISQSQPNPLLRVNQIIQAELEDLNRNIGRYDLAIAHSSAAVAELERLGELSSFQELADAKVRLAAALFNGHDFQAAIKNLMPIVEEIKDNPLLVTAECEIRTYNTLGRVMIQLNRPSWEQWFRQSIDLQRTVDPDNVSRTSCYLIHGLLRCGQLETAKVEIDKLSSMQLDLHSKIFLAFYRSEYYRRCGDVCEQAYMTDTELETNGCGRHAFAFYLQATARQNERSLQDSADRFDRAADVFEKEVGPFSEMNILKLFSHFMRLSSAIRRQDRNAFHLSLQAIQEFFSMDGAEPIRIWYSDYLPSGITDVRNLDKLLDRVPYF